MVRDSWGFDPRTQFLASRGYVVLKVNYRGSSGYGAAFQKAGLHARLDTVLLDDIADGVRFLIARGEVDPSRVAIMGASFGGWATYLSLIKYPDLYRAGVAIAAVSNWRQSLRDERWKFSNKGGYSFWKALLSRDGFAEQEKFIDPYLRAAELKQPIYIMHGSRDRVVSAVGADMMITALRKTNPNVCGRVFPFAGPGGWSYDDRVVELNEIGAFLERHLGPPTPDAVAPAQP
jgi:dipeptidyl aminopeptidase/acylaminoacyl peptidase